MANFTEKQKFTDWGVGVFFALLGLPLLIFVILYLVSRNEEMLAALCIITLTFIFVGLLFFLPILKTEINDKGIYITFKPFTNRLITWNEIKEAEVIKYSFVGYGWRLSLKYGKVYNIKGNKGLFVQLKNKKKVLIGTQKEIEMRTALALYLAKLGQ